MNECFAADPGCISKAIELKILLEKFGLSTGRHLIQYPNDWENQVLQRLSSLPPVEAKRVTILLQRAKECLGLIRSPRLPWLDKKSWAENAGMLTAPPSPRLDGVVVQNGTPRLPFNAIEFDDLDLPPTAEELIASTPDEYLRVSNLLLLASHELILIDPYLSPCEDSVSPVLELLMYKTGSNDSKCTVMKLYARASSVLGKSTLAQVKAGMRNLIEKAKIKKPFRITLLLLDDIGTKVRMHDRYLCSVKGGIQFSQGFQVQRANRKITASPLGPTLHKNVWGTYFDRQHDMRIVHSLTESSAYTVSGG